MLSLRSWGDASNTLVIQLVDTGSGEITFENTDGSKAEKFFTIDEVWKLFPIVDSLWYLLRPSVSLAFLKSLGGEERLPSWFFRELREFLNQDDEGDV